MPTRTMQRLMSRFRSTWTDWAGIATIIAVALYTFFSYAPTDQRRWITLGVLLVFLLIQDCDTDRIAPDRGAWVRHLCLSLLTLLVITLVLLEADPMGQVILFFVLSTYAMAVLPTRSAFAWIVLFGGVTIWILMVALNSSFLGLLNGLGACCGYFFLGSAANAQQRSERAHAASQRLLSALQTAHQQLQLQAMQAEELAISQERNRLAREMHDTLGHRLTVAATQLEGAQKLIPRNPDKAATMVRIVRQQVLEGLQELRHTVATLRTPIEEQLPLPTALARLVSTFETATGMHTEVSCPAPIPNLPTAHRQALYRAVQEGLTNIQKHAHAQTVQVSLRCTDAAASADGRHDPQVQVTVQDDGQGLSAVLPPTGYGLRGLQERAEHLHGTCSLHAVSGQGARLRMTLPLPAPNDHKAVETPGGHPDHG